MHILSFLFVCREHLCPFPVIDYLFYLILVGEQEGTIRTKWYRNFKSNIGAFQKTCTPSLKKKM
jgi:hypothetical protein